MGLIDQNSSEYYEGEIIYTPAGTVTISLPWPNNMTPLIWANNATATSLDNYDVYIDNVKQYPTLSPYYITQVLTSTITNGVPTQILALTSNPDPTTGATTIIPTSSILAVRLKNESLWDNYKEYEYISLKDIVNNFMLSYVGTDKVISRVKRSDVIFHAKRGLQEFSYDTLRSVNIQELTVPASLALVIPQDYVNYVQLSWIDNNGVKHIIYPTTLTVNPTFLPLQDSAGIPTQDIYGNALQSEQSLVNDRWRKANSTDISGNISSQDVNNGSNVFGWSWWRSAYGQRYGLDPVTSQKNGWFTIDQRRGVFAFSGDLQGRLITLEYISDGLAYDTDSKVPKMAEDALYSYMVYNIISYMPKTPEYIVQRFKREKSAKLRNAKIRLSNIKMGEFTQVMRGKSKWIKH
tara:strand:- start:406 stop:1626 length:1221 start_codon:yes stop_codon:yes gene_type:complete